jgi:hypothetical protein
MDDEGWYLYLMRDLHSGAFPSQFHKLLNNVFYGNIYLIRVVNYFATILSIAVFCYGLYCFLKNQFELRTYDLLLMFSFCLLGFSIFSPRVCDVFYYVTLNREIALLSTGLLLLAFVNNNKALILTSGFLIGFQFFIMITTTPIILIFILLIYVYSYTPLKYITLFIIGVLLSFIYYFSFVESLRHFFINEIVPHISDAVSTDTANSHGFLQIFRWCYMAIYFILSNGLLGALMILGLITLKNVLTNQQRYFFIFLIAITAIFYYYNEVIKGEHHVASITPFISIYLFFIINQLFIKKKHQHFTILFITILSFSFFLSIGSYVDYKTRAADYIGFIFPFIYVFSVKLYNTKYTYIIIGIITLYLANNCSMIYRENWGGFTYNKQNISLQKLNIHQNLKVDTMVYNNLKLMKSAALNEGEAVIISYKNLAGYTYLLNLNLISSLSYLPENIKEEEYKKYNHFSLLENTYHPFTSEYIAKIKTQENYQLTDTIELGVFKVYKMEKRHTIVR